MKFAAFIMTYERSDILLNTINKILAQTTVPEKILVVDNSASNTTEAAIKLLNNPQIEYYRVGYNSGPAGAAFFGLSILAEQGYDWIYWGDDDDPPLRDEIFEELLNLARSGTNVGAIGSVGGFLNKYLAKTSGLRNKDIDGMTEVDYIPGGYNLIVNGEMVNKSILPTKELFFGFEELDFCIKVKRAGYKLYVDGETLLQGRKRLGMGDSNYKWKGNSFGMFAKLNRNYYSIRNLLYVMYINKYYMGFAWLLSKTIFKMIFAFRFGVDYGIKNSKVSSSAIRDFAKGRLGQRVSF